MFQVLAAERLAFNLRNGIYLQTEDRYFSRTEICPWGIVGIEEERDTASDATKQIQLSACDAWKDRVLLAPEQGLAGADCCQRLELK